MMMDDSEQTPQRSFYRENDEGYSHPGATHVRTFCPLLNVFFVV